MVERVCHLCESLSIEDENHFILEFPPYTHISSMFHSIFYNTNLYNFLTCQDYSQHENILTKCFDHTNKILNRPREASLGHQWNYVEKRALLDNRRGGRKCWIDQHHSS